MNLCLNSLLVLIDLFKKNEQSAALGSEHLILELIATRDLSTSLCDYKCIDLSIQGWNCSCTVII